MLAYARMISQITSMLILWCEFCCALLLFYMNRDNEIMNFLGLIKAAS